ncbi:AAA family ATPase [Prevotellamassilia timonensis]|uniref:nSTAND3 domain-containing NTPase n=1 Tax=Prevotellamassilia timonensis TaxID=1852370 RepID=UPI001F22118F|nr:AAA family ATPase [Prevotellamassilia timonensis]MCF2634786.1 AAA family ATPase [Prevotellamassilia timonensis]
MLDYDFKILQPSEFECFSRDLLQAREDIFIESFADGRDKGIDLRFAYSKDKTCIVQCKRYKEWKELKGKLKEEVEKVKRLSPQRYILTTSVDLTVKQKDEVLAMFNPFILSGMDVLGKKDLNNLLEKNPEIEKNYHKLWLASTNVLNTIINRATLNWSSFELEKIEKDIRLYVENESLNKALDVLKENHYVVISGIPGIGKTTLARMLVYTMLARGYEEFVYVDDMDTAAKMFSKEKRQIFFFDDFLGANSFVQQSVSFENKLITFIDKVRNSKHTLFILSTREYVLSEAMAHYEKLSMSNIDIAKCTIELEYYTKTIRAKILYNHLAEANIPPEYINVFIDKRGYMTIINHQNFNPRVIESIIKEQIWETIDSNDFANKVKEFFDNPISVWQFAFEKLDVETRYTLLVLGTMGGHVRLDDFQEGYRQFCILTSQEVGLKYDDVKWRQSLKVLMNCFLKIDNRNGIKLVTMYNPSIADFIVFYLNQNTTTALQIIRGACFIEQLYNVFSDNRDFAVRKNLVYVDEDSFPVIETAFKRIWNERRTCQLKDRIFYDAERDDFVETRILYDFKTKYPFFSKQYSGFAEKLYNADELTWQTVKLKHRIGLMNLLDWNHMFRGADGYIPTIIENETLDTDEWIELVETVKDLNVEDEVLNDSFYDKLDDDLKSEISGFSDQGECDEEFKKVESLKKLLPDWKWYDVYGEIDDAEKRIKEEEDEADYDDDYEQWRSQSEKEDAQIDEMFGALRWN